jgi:hypothetical protein
MTHVDDLRLKASECRREAGRLEELARMAAERAGGCCRDHRGEEWVLLEATVIADGLARLLEGALGWRPGQRRG